MLTSPLRVRPNLLVIGAQKAGTTSLHALLAEHPEIVMSRVKECGELVRERPSAWRHRAFFPLRGSVGHAVRWAGESTPYYIFHPEVPARAAAMMPGVRAIAVLRDPVARAWSHHRHAVRHGLERLPFEEALAREEERMSESAWSHRHHSYFSRGCYAAQLERWFATLGRERVLVLSFAELRDGCREPRQAIESFLGLASPLAEGFPLRNRGEGDGEGIPAGIAESLRARFLPHDVRLAALLARTMDWMKP